MSWDFDDAVVVDVVTTGFDPEHDKVISVAALRFRFSHIQLHTGNIYLETYYSMVRSERKSLERYSVVHGIVNNNEEGESTFGEIAEELRDFIGERPIIAYNATFAKKFLTAEFKRAGVKTLHRNRSYCAMQRFQNLTGQRQDFDLDTVAAILGVGQIESDIHKGFNKAKQIFEIAYKFYLHDNGVKRIDLDDRRMRRKRSDSSSWRPTKTEKDNIGCLVNIGVCMLVLIVVIVYLFS